MKKETVVIVHGTWAAPEKGETKWYEPCEADSADNSFVGKLDAALLQRGSGARCWGHCAGGEPIFQWSGENNWIARAAAAAALANYIGKVQSNGWICHIIAHSHGGNVVVEALTGLSKQISNRALGKIVTLGTPYIDAMSPVLKRSAIINKRINVFLRIVLFILVSIVAFVHTSTDVPFSIYFYLVIYSVIFFPIFLRQNKFVNAERKDLSLTVMNSPYDEAWQILYHLRTVENPIAVRTGFAVYCWKITIQNFKLRVHISKLYGSVNYTDLSRSSRAALFALHLSAIVYWCFLFWYYDIDLFTLIIMMFVFTIAILLILSLVPEKSRATFYLASLSPIRFLYHVVLSLISVWEAFGTYYIRNKSWSVLLKMAMGLDGYRLPAPLVERCPTVIPEDFVNYENMPDDVQQRALKNRNAWVERHLGNVSEAFSRLAITASDLSSLLKTVESDQTLVHGAYYSDDECIKRIADWIADYGGVSKATTAIAATPQAVTGA